MDTRLTDFIAFLRDSKLKYKENAIRFVKSDIHGFGVEAIADIAAGETVATITKKAIISVETATLWDDINKVGDTSQTSGDKLSQSSNNTNDDFDDHARDNWCPPLFQLPAAVLFESLLGKRSKWFRYINILPDSLAEIGVPLAESDETLDQIFKGTAVDLLARNMRKVLEDVFNHYIHKLFVHRTQQLGITDETFQNATPEQFMLAFAWVTSRAFEVDSFYDNSLVPIADIFNHRTDGEHVHIEGGAGSSDSDDSDEELAEGNVEDNVDTNNESEIVQNHGKPKGKDAKTQKESDYDELSIVCVKDIKAGSEVFNTFGQKSNTVLYLNYGFTEKNNAYEAAFLHKDDVEMAINAVKEKESSLNDQMTPQREACIQACEFVTNHEVVDDFFQIVTDGTFCRGLLSLLYLYYVPWSKISAMAADEFDIGEHLMQLSTEDVLKIAPELISKTIKRFASILDEKYPPGTSLEGDEKALNNSDGLSRLELNALRIRLGQRKAMKIACEKLFATIEESANEGKTTACTNKSEQTALEPRTKKAKTG